MIPALRGYEVSFAKVIEASKDYSFKVEVYEFVPGVQGKEWLRGSDQTIEVEKDEYGDYKVNQLSMFWSPDQS